MNRNAAVMALKFNFHITKHTNYNEPLTSANTTVQFLLAQNIIDKQNI